VAKKAGLFTGEMKRVVQLLAGQNAEIPYGHQWSKVHGIFINALTNQRWVIEIESNGITTWVLEVQDIPCRSDSQPIVGYLPVPVADLDAVTGKIELCDADYLSDLYDNGGPLLGGYMPWAFSASGHEAQVVISYAGFGAEGEYSKAFRYKLVFSADENGNPDGVTLSLEQEGFAWNRNIRQNVRAPAMSFCGPSLPYALYWRGLSNPPTDEVFSFPVTVFSEGETEHVFTMTVMPVTVEETEATASPAFDHNDDNSFIFDPDYMGVDIYSAQSTTTSGAISTTNGTLTSYGNISTMNGAII
jgi:hypothetical protein